MNKVAGWIRSQPDLLDGLLAADDANVLFQTVSSLAATVERSGGRLSPYGLSRDLAEAIIAKAIYWEELLRLIKEDEPPRPNPTVTVPVRAWVTVSLSTTIERDVTAPESALAETAREECVGAASDKLEKLLPLLEAAGFDIDGTFPNELQIFNSETGQSIY
jgi:hypothetical protein